jgi:hypothetical protein
MERLINAAGSSCTRADYDLFMESVTCLHDPVDLSLRTRVDGQLRDLAIKLVACTHDAGNGGTEQGYMILAYVGETGNRSELDQWDWARTYGSREDALEDLARIVGAILPRPEVIYTAPVPAMSNWADED